MERAIILEPADNVATALGDLKTGEVIALRIADKRVSVEVAEEIPFGHKFALADMAAGSDVVKYGRCIGVTTSAIRKGAHVHVHNIRGKRGGVR